MNVFLAADLNIKKKKRIDMRNFPKGKRQTNLRNLKNVKKKKIDEFNQTEWSLRQIIPWGKNKN